MTQNRSVPATTTRVILPGLVEPDGLVVDTTAEVTRPGDGELLVEVEATGISYAEQAMRRGRYFAQPAFPFTPGYDVVGTVLAVGPGVGTDLIGQRVAVLTKTGGWAAHVVVAARDAVGVPDGVPADVAEAVTVNGVTAWQMLHRSAHVLPGQTILVFGANGGVGGLVVQMARHAGIRVIAAASPRHHDALRAAGAIPVDYADPDLAATVGALAPADGLAAVFDNVGGATTRTSWSLLGRGGTLVSYAIVAAVGGTGSLWPPFLKHVGRIVTWNALPNGKHATFYDLWAGHTTRKATYRAHLDHDLTHVLELVRDGVLTPTIAARFALSDVSAALELAESRTLNGKVVLLP